MKKSISVIIPFFNSKMTLARMLESILNSTLVPYEILLIDDGSTDESSEIAKDYASKHSCISYIRKEHSGVSASRNLGIKKASGEYISFLDADDFIEPDMFERLLDASLSTPEKNCAGAICGYFTHKDNLVTPYFISSDKFMDSKTLLKSMFTEDNVRGFLFTRLFKGEFIKNSGLSFNEEISMCEDLLFQTALFTHKNVQFAIVNAPLYHYVQNSSSATGTKAFFLDGHFVYAPAFTLIKKELANSDVSFVEDSYYSIIKNCMFSLLLSYKKGDKSAKTQIRQLQKLIKSCPQKDYSLNGFCYRYAPFIYSLKLPKS